MFALCRPPEHQLAITRAAFDAYKNQEQAELDEILAASQLASKGCDVSGSVLLQVRAKSWLFMPCVLPTGYNTQRR